MPRFRYEVIATAHANVLNGSALRLQQKLNDGRLDTTDRTKDGKMLEPEDTVRVLNILYIENQPEGFEYWTTVDDLWRVRVKRIEQPYAVYVKFIIDADGEEVAEDRLEDELEHYIDTRLSWEIDRRLTETAPIAE